MLVNYTRRFRSEQNIIRHFAVLLGIDSKIHYKKNKDDFFKIRSQSTFPRPTSLPFFKEQNEFMSCLPKVLESLAEKKEYSDLAFVTERFSKFLEYNVPIGDKIKGVTTTISYKILKKSEDHTDKNIELANILGWCAELFEAADIIIEDIIHSSETQKKFLYKLPDVGTDGFLNPFILEMCIYNLLKTYFSTHLFYTHMVHFFHFIFYKAAMGRLLGCQKFNIDNVNMNTFHRIAKYKIGYDDFYVGITLGMYLSRIYNNALHKQITPILMDISKYYRIQRDLQDYNNSNAACTGNTGKNIAEGRCNWLVAVALQKSNDIQRQIIKINYGRKEDEAIQAILDVYRSLDIISEFHAYEEDSFKTLCNNVDKLENSSIRNLLGLIIKELYNH